MKFWVVGILENYVLMKLGEGVVFDLILDEWGYVGFLD